MPLLQITSNQARCTDTSTLKHISRELATLLGKPEQYVMLNPTHNPHMLFAGDDAPLAYVELKSLGLPEQETPKLSAALCKLLSEQLEVDPARIYIEFSSPPRHLWGWNASTF